MASSNAQARAHRTSAAQRHAPAAAIIVLACRLQLAGENESANKKKTFPKFNQLPVTSIFWTLISSIKFRLMTKSISQLLP
jgi:hypothetical protein